ncbi:MAG: UbiA prenyltransferase family protein [archaeon]
MAANQKLLKKKAIFSKKVQESSTQGSKKKWSFVQKIAGFVELGRPMEWSKSLLNMMIALLMAFYVYSAGINLWVFAAGFFSVAFLWSGLYALNDFTDWRIDLVHNVKKNRPIPSGKVSPLQGFLFSIILIIVSFLIGFALNNFMLIVCLFAMVLNQYLYTMKPFRLKTKKGFDMISGSMVNPTFRYLSGLVLFVPPAALFSQITPILPFLFVIGIQFSGYSLYRLFSKGHDLKVKMNSTVALVPEKRVKLISYLVILVAVVSYMLLFMNFFTFKIEALGFLPGQYLYPIVIALLFLPFMKEAILDPVKANMKNQYRIIYLMTMIFIFGNFAVFLLIP